MKAKAIIIALAALTLLVGCKKEEEEPQSIVNGTKWTTSYADNIMVLEFTSESEVIGYFAKPGGAIMGNVFNGTYKESGNEITFTGLKYVWIYAHYKLVSATVNGSIMTTHGKETWDIENGPWIDWDDNWNKQ